MYGNSLQCNHFSAIFFTNIVCFQQNTVHNRRTCTTRHPTISAYSSLSRKRLRTSASEFSPFITGTTPKTTVKAHLGHKSVAFYIKITHFFKIRSFLILKTNSKFQYSLLVICTIFSQYAHYIQNCVQSYFF